MKKLLVRAILVVAGLLLAEVGLRLVLWGSGNPYDSANCRAEVEAALLEMGVRNLELDKERSSDRSQQTFLHPFYGFETLESHDSLAWQVEYASRLVRLQSGESPSARDPLTILVTGGSVARIFAGRGDNGGAQALVETIEASAAHLDRPVVVLNHGREAFKQPQQLMLLAYLFSLGMRPDLVVNIDGFNEVGIGLLNPELGSHPLYPSNPHWSQLLGLNSTSELQAAWREEVVEVRADARKFAELGQATGLYSSAICGNGVRAYVRSCLADWRGYMKEFMNSPSTGELDVARSGLPIAEAEEIQFDSIVNNWVESSASLNALCRERGIPYLHVLQPTLHDEGSKVLTKAEAEQGTAHPAIARGVRLGYPKLRAAIPRLLERGVPFLDASGLFEGREDRIYYDLCHFNRPGTELLGVAVGAALIEPVNSLLKPD